ncbi:glycosyltransferase [Mucilaginibacter lutimaris]|uniref:Glycosyltransferase n=1 Tax=Mucilaginibacter lutimaris TaxID=931629 RepID=A0ABW2ZL85_9SPHI
MIFVTTGTQEPFDRLLKAVDVIASKLNNVPFHVQAFSKNYKATHVKISEFMTPDDFDQNIKNATLIISHAGMGTIISALVKAKPIVIMPRLLKYNEHRNEHQLATAKKLDDLKFVHVAYDEDELIAKILEIWPDKIESLHQVGEQASTELLASLGNYIKK